MIDTDRWAVTHCIHIWPLEDLVEHDLGEDCVCAPDEKVEPAPNGSRFWTFTHHSLDGREAAE